MSLKSLAKTVTSAGTAERLDASDRLVRCVAVRAKPANTGSIYIGDATVSSSDPGVSPGDRLDVRGDPYLNLFDIFIDADTNGEGVDVWYLDYA